jgi:hypothetical protein
MSCNYVAKILKLCSNSFGFWFSVVGAEVVLNVLRPERKNEEISSLFWYFANFSSLGIIVKGWFINW